MLNTRSITEGSDTAGEVRAAGARLRPRRSPRLIALGVLCVVLGGLGAAALYSTSTDYVPAVVMAKDVLRGQEITASDLEVVELPSSTRIDYTEGSETNELVGERPLVDLPAGSFPVDRHFGSSLIPEGHRLVGLLLAPGKMPASELAADAKVQLVSIIDDDDWVAGAVISKVPALTDDGSGFVVDVIVDQDAADQATRLAATEQLALMAVGED